MESKSPSFSYKDSFLKSHLIQIDLDKQVTRFSNILQNHWLKKNISKLIWKKWTFFAKNYALNNTVEKYWNV